MFASSVFADLDGLSQFNQINVIGVDDQNDGGLDDQLFICYQLTNIEL